MLQYYVVLRSVLRAKPCLRRCLTRCRHCRIFFLTHPRNAGRSDLGCPFGCRDAHSKRSSTERSVQYYASEVGKFKKKIQNGKRRQKGLKPGFGARQEGTGPELVPDGSRFDAGMVCHVQMVTSLIEGRRVGRQEILAMLARAMRQHSMARGRRIDYVLRYLKTHAP